MGGVSRPWSQQEDFFLRIAVAKHGVHDNWKVVADDVPGRNNKACRKRWLHSLSPAIKKSAWTMAEDALLAHLYNIHGPKWSLIARQIDGRTDDACSKRYNDALDPNLKRDEWTADEDTSLIQVHAEIGGKWREIGFRLQRSPLACRNRFKLLERKQQRPSLQAPSSTSQTQNDFDSSLPYYPPESYPLFSAGDPPVTFRESTPEAAALVPPPFQYSSSSLSAALQERPPISHQSTPTKVVDDRTPGSSSTPSPFVLVQEFDNGSMLLDELSDSSLFITDRNSLPTYHSHQSIYGFVANDGGVCPAGPSQLELMSQSNADAPDKLLLPSTLEELMTLPNHNLFNESPYSIITPELSPSPSSPLGQTGASTSSSPWAQSRASPLPSSPLGQTGTPLSSSPTASVSTELATESLPSQSLLFSTSYAGPEHPVTLNKELVPARKHNNQGPTRLSSSLPLPDESLRPYACGHSGCWPADAVTSIACFSTSRELFEHVKLHSEPEDEKPFRCALPGCNKFWRSLNGLQYHLQLSAAHFQQAMSRTFSSQNMPTLQERDASAESDAAADNTKRYVCDRPNCFKSYKNSSGLRYHKKHGHPTTLPMQLDNVPPALARNLPARTRKMRKKDANEIAVATASA